MGLVRWITDKWTKRWRDKKTITSPEISQMVSKESNGKLWDFKCQYRAKRKVRNAISRKSRRINYGLC